MALGTVKRRIPILSLPLRLEGESLATVAYGSVEDVAQCVYAIVSYERGSRLEDVQFGVDDPTFEAIPLDVSEWLTAIARYEPRAAVRTAQDIQELTDVVELAVGATR